jgi:hypothetical protein
MEVRKKIILLILVVFSISCKKSGCNGAEGYNIFSLPNPYRNYFSQLPESYVDWKCDNGLTDRSFVYSDTDRFNYDINDNYLDPKTCYQNAWQLKIVQYGYSLLNKNKIFSKIYLKENKDVCFELWIQYYPNSLQSNWVLVKILNNNSNCKTYSNKYHDVYFAEDSIFSFDTDFSTIDSMVINSINYKDVFHIINQKALLDGNQFEITDVYVDKYVGVIRYKLKNGQLWDIVK